MQWTFQMCMCLLSRFTHVQLFVISWTIACQAPLSMGFSRQEHWSGSPCPPPGGLPDPGTEPASLLLHWQAGSLPLVLSWKPKMMWQGLYWRTSSVSVFKVSFGLARFLQEESFNLLSEIVRLDRWKQVGWGGASHINIL